MSEQPVSIFWMRRDLRWVDNKALHHALNGEYPVLPLFIFDKDILDDLSLKKDARLEFIRDRLIKLTGDLASKGSAIHFRYGRPESEWEKILTEFNVREVFTNEDYEPYAIQRDEAVASLLAKHDIPFRQFKDQVIMAKDEIVKEDGQPYMVFTPYSKKWLGKLSDVQLEGVSSALRFDRFAGHPQKEPPTLEAMGFRPSGISIPSMEIDEEMMKNYASQRDFPAREGTSRLGMHLRFGTISIRKVVATARGLSKTFLNELIWREFYMMILFHFPRVVTENFQTKYDSLKWKNDRSEFRRWCEGTTGYPIVDAGMRQLNTTGYMHNRVRMIVASFLTKHLLIDWRWGEAYFAERLLDYELASNNGGWQWAAGTGTDAQPYFRIFNPWSQTDKFDPERKYIKQWVPEFEEDNYPDPIVDHKEARQRALDTYKAAVG